MDLVVIVVDGTVPWSMAGCCLPWSDNSAHVERLTISRALVMVTVDSSVTTVRIIDGRMSDELVCNIAVGGTSDGLSQVFHHVERCSDCDDSNVDIEMAPSCLMPLDCC